MQAPSGRTLCKGLCRRSPLAALESECRSVCGQGDKIPDIARTMGKAMAQLKNATNDIKSEIQKGSEANGIGTSLKELTSTFTTEVEKVKESLDTNITAPLEKSNLDIEEITGPIKRQL